MAMARPHEWHDDRHARSRPNLQEPEERARRPCPRVDLEVGAGEIFGFLGPNGAGKTTTLRMLATLLTPTSGEATIAGADLRREPQAVRERIGYVPQGGLDRPGRDRPRRARHPGPPLRHVDRSSAQRRASEVLETLDLESAADRAISTYLGGMKRRLEVGLGIVHRPRSCSSTSRPPASTPRRERACGTRSAVCAKRARPCS